MEKSDNKEKDTSQRVRIKPNFVSGTLVALAYITLVFIFSKILGIPYNEIVDSTSNVLKALVLPVAVISLSLAAFIKYAGWWDGIFTIKKMKDKWLWLLPLSIVGTEASQLIRHDWGATDMAFVAAVLVGTLFVGFGEELLARGLLVKAYRKSLKTERSVALLSSLVFGLLHFVNLLGGQDTKTTLLQVISAGIFGYAMYITMRVSGSLILPMVLHAFWDFSSLVKGEINSLSVGEAVIEQNIFFLVAMVVMIASIFFIKDKTKNLTK